MTGKFARPGDRQGGVMDKIKIKLILREGISDANGYNCGYNYQIHEVELPLKAYPLEVIGGEWERIEAGKEE